MTVFQVTVEDYEVEALLTRMDITLSPQGLAAFLTETGTYAIQSAGRDLFQDEGGPSVGGAWAPLAPSTQEIRSSQGYGAAHPINRRTGDLEDFITNSSGRIEVDPTGATLTYPGGQATGDLQDALQMAQAGGVSDSGKKISARPVLAASPVMMSEIVMEMMFFIAGRRP